MTCVTQNGSSASDQCPQNVSLLRFILVLLRKHLADLSQVSRTRKSVNVKMFFIDPRKEIHRLHLTQTSMLLGNPLGAVGDQKVQMWSQANVQNHLQEGSPVVHVVG